MESSDTLQQKIAKSKEQKKWQQFLVTLFKIKSSERAICMLKHVVFAKTVQNRKITNVIFFSSTSLHFKKRGFKEKLIDSFSLSLYTSNR